MVRRILASLALCTVLSPLMLAQSAGDRIDLYFGDWHNATPRTTMGALSERDIYTRGDGVNPTQKGALLRFINSYTYGTLAPGASTKATKLSGQQLVFFVDGGQGSVTAGGQTEALRRNIAVLMPANLEFTLKNTGSEPLAMYMVNEPTPAGFRPNSTMLVRDETKTPITTSSGHWAHIVKTLFTTADGLATLEAFLTVTLDPLTIGQPHVHQDENGDIEEIWTALDGTSLAFVGNQLRKQPPGLSFYHIPDNKTPHTNINQSEDSQVRFLYVGRYHPHQPRP
jgi:mannose-6-phosphate isomerase-like protein (cupin superfamily)